MIDIKKLIYVPASCAILMLSGCVATTEQSVEETLILPDSFSESGMTELAGKWWQAFEDEQLNDLVEQALEDNFSLKSSWARLSQARAVYNKSRAGIFPTIDGDGSANHAIDYNDGSSTKSDYLSFGLSASYEIDLWGRIDSEVEASRFDMEATAAEL